MYLNSKVDLFEDVEFNIQAEVKDSETASSYEDQFFYCSTYDSLSKIGRNIANFLPKK